MAHKKIMKANSTLDPEHEPELSYDPERAERIRDLADRIRAAEDSAEVERLGNELYEFMFGSADAHN
jgi:hypothetical protein